jgi:hypothetical protein
MLMRLRKGNDGDRLCREVGELDVLVTFCNKEILLGAARIKILITAALHYRERWFRWLIEKGSDYDLVCIAGKDFSEAS